MTPQRPYLTGRVLLIFVAGCLAAYDGVTGLLHAGFSGYTSATWQVIADRAPFALWPLAYLALWRPRRGLAAFLAVTVLLISICVSHLPTPAGSTSPADCFIRYQCSLVATLLLVANALWASFGVQADRRQPPLPARGSDHGA